MRHAQTIAALAMLAGGCAVTRTEVHAADPEHARQAFELLVALAGHWRGTATSGAQQFPVDVSYEVVSAGSVVMERLFQGTEHEMVTMYHQDGERLLLTHYCSQGNQPRMELVGWSAQPEATASFAYADSTNWAGPEQLIMHDARITWISRDHIAATWTAWVNGKADHTASFDLERQTTRSLGY